MAKKKGEEGERRTQMPVRLTADVLDRVRNMLYWAPRGRKFQTFAEQAIINEITKIEQEENGGKPYKARPEGQ